MTITVTTYGNGFDMGGGSVQQVNAAGFPYFLALPLNSVSISSGVVQWTTPWPYGVVGIGASYQIKAVGSGFELGTLGQIKGTVNSITISDLNGRVLLQADGLQSNEPRPFDLGESGLWSGELIGGVGIVNLNYGLVWGTLLSATPGTGNYGTTEIINGTSGNDTLIGGAGVVTTFNSGAGNDRIFVTDADSTPFVDGGPGVDTVAFDWYLSQVLEIVPNKDGSYLARLGSLLFDDQGNAVQEGSTHEVKLVNVEWVAFNNGNVRLTPALFTTGTDTVSFDRLNSAQQAAVLGGANLYQAFDGDDTIVLPDNAHERLVVGGGIYWDYWEEFDAGLGKDVFDFQAVELNGLKGFSSGSNLKIYGGAGDAGRLLETTTWDKSSGATNNDRLKLPYAANDYDVSVSFAPLGPDPMWDQTHTIVKTRTNTSNALPAITIDARSIEADSFATSISNNISGSGGPGTPVDLAVEAAKLAWEVYGPQSTYGYMLNGKPYETLGHPRESLAYESGNIAALTVGISNAAQSRNWHPVSAIELGILPADFASDGTVQHPYGTTLHYSFVQGHFQAYDSSQIARISGDLPEADALVLTGLVNGTKTLAISFRGTDQSADVFDWFDFNTHYEKFAPLIDGISRFASDPSNGISQILVTGHSIGAGMVQRFLGFLAESSLANKTVHAYAFGSPGYNGLNLPPQLAGELTNFIHTDDPILLAPKAIAGSKILINSGISSTLFSTAEHSMRGYLADIIKLQRFDNDPLSPFDLTTQSGFRVATGKPEDPFISDPLLGQYSHVIHSDWTDNYVLGNNGNDEIYWDMLVANQGYRIVDGGDGVDRVFMPANASDWRIESNGVDESTLFYLPGNAIAPALGELHRIEKIVFLSSDPTNPFPVQSLNGTALTKQVSVDGNSPLQVDPSKDYCDAGDGTGTVTGSGADDTVFFGAGSRTIVAGAGNDIIQSKAGSGSASDVVVIDGGVGADVMKGGIGSNVYIADDPQDVVIDGGGYDEIRSSVDYALPDGTEKLTLLAGASTGTGNALANIIVGNASDNVLDGGSGNDSLDAGDGNDSISGGPGFDYLVGGAGNDTLRGGEQGDTLVGGYGDDYLSGGKGLDNLDGGEGNDTLVGGLGSDSLSGGNGIDTVDYSAATEGVTINLNVTTAQFISSGQASDTLSSIENIIAGQFSDNVVGDGGNNVLTGNNGDDTLYGGDGFDTIDGGDGNDFLSGMNQADLINGGIGDDFLGGGKGLDTLNGGEGNDTLQGGLGSDNLTGGNGADTFVFSTALDGLTNVDTITDFVHGIDKMQLSAAVFAGLGSVGSTVSLSAKLAYNAVSGVIAYDADGAGGNPAITFAILGTSVHPATLGADFQIIA